MERLLLAVLREHCVPHASAILPIGCQVFKLERETRRLILALLLVAAIALALRNCRFSLTAPITSERFTDIDLVVRELPLRVSARIALIALARLNEFS
jgi:hypothetical protein